MRYLQYLLLIMSCTLFVLSETITKNDFSTNGEPVCTVYSMTESSQIQRRTRRLCCLKFKPYDSPLRKKLMKERHR